MTEGREKKSVRVRVTGEADVVRATAADWPWGTAVIVLFLGYVVTVLLSAWLADDAYITFRVVDNVIHGLGPVWNVGERVQAYTNPLMMLSLSALSMVTREVYFTSLVFSMFASASAVAILAFRVARSRVSAALALLILVSSSSFVTYSTSGLENCLIFLLSALFFWEYFRSERHDARSLTILTLLFSLSLVNRMDTALLLAPALFFAYIRNEKVGLWRMAAAAVTGMMPFVAWEAFAVVYYGFAFPNTAYAKLSTGIASSEYLVRGAWYYVMSLLQDPVVLLAVGIGSVPIFLSRRAKTIVPFIGVVLYLAYIAKIGGDFMRGRFFAAPLFVVLLILVSIDPEQWSRMRITTRTLVFATLTLVLIQNVGGMVFNAMDFNHVVPYGIYNDKAIYFPASNLPLNLVGRQLQKSPLVKKGEVLRASGESPVVWATLGFTGYYAGPRIHIVDPLALSDALLARLPAIYDPEWHIGHMVRFIPEGYLETIKSGKNVIRDPGVAEYYDHLAVVIKGPLWTRARWKTIYELNTGKFDHLIDRQYYRFGVTNPLDIDSL